MSLGAIGYLAWFVDWREAADAFSRLRPWAFALAVGSVALGVVAATVRWRALLVAFGGTDLPRWSELLRLYLVSLFYNTFLPGAVAGDVVRGVASRRVFGEKGATAGVAVVFVERVLGLAGLLALTASTALYSNIGDRRWVVPLAVLSGLAAVGAFVAVAAGERVASRLPGFAGRWASKLPRLERLGPVLPAFLLSIVTHVVVALAGHALIVSMAKDTAVTESLAVIPLASAAAFFPFTVSGMGARETAFVHLYALVGVPSSISVITALGLWFSQTVVAAVGGVLVLLRPVSMSSP
ncbi:MAG: flippase-like domain-containing protein [Myxococcales bacterium]|nr:flippase-like domain-containing protein [Myxococcales bacterium]